MIRQDLPEITFESSKGFKGAERCEVLDESREVLGSFCNIEVP